MEYEYKTSKDLLLLFQERKMGGIVGEDNHDFIKNQNTIDKIGYYKIKQYSFPFYDENALEYHDITFKQLIDRYYRDQALKQEIFQIITDIEASIDSKIADVLGEYDPYEYLNFGKWCQKNSKNKFLGNKNMDKYAVKKEELNFLSSLQYKIKKSNFQDLVTFKENKTDNFFPPVWLMVNTLTFGESIHIIKLMSKKRRGKIAASFEMNVNTFINWLDLLNLIRNICCHNGDLVDIKLKTNPSVPIKYRKYLRISRDGESLPHSLAIIICVILEFMQNINPKHKIYNLFEKLNKLCSINKYSKDKLAQDIGFRDFYAMKRMVFSFYKNKTVIFYPNGNINLKK